MHRGGRALGLLAAASVAAAAAAHEAAHEAAQPQVLAPGYGRLQFEPPEPGSYALPALGPAPDGEVLDAAGARMRLHALYDGAIVLLAFVYTSCPDATGCPLALAVLDRVKARLDAEPELAKQARLLTLSFDPERDTPEVMRSLAAGFPARNADWRFLTTASVSQLEPILEAYGQPVQREVGPDGRPTGRFSHILRVFLIDRQKRIRNVYSSSFLHADLALADVRTLLLEERGASPSRREPGLAPPGGPVDLLALAGHPPLGLPALPVPEGNPLTERGIALGRKLFFDRRLSQNGTISCAICHIPEQGFTSHELATAVGIEGRTVRRNSPTLYNVAYVRRLFHDGRETRLEAQVWGPLLAANEMGNASPDAVVERVAALPDYEGLFERAFGGRGPGAETLGMALASYQRTLLSANSRFDRWRFGGEEEALDAAAERGFQLFSGKAACATCHPIGPESGLFSDGRFHDTGIGYRRSAGGPSRHRVEVAPGRYVEVGDEVLAAISEPPPSDLGRYEVTGDPGDRWRYRTPSLRNVALTAPYMHDGSLRTLRDVVEFYDAGGVPHEGLDPLIRPLGLEPREIADLVAFLESLTGDSVGRLVLDARAAPIGELR